MRRILVALGSGFLFAVGLALSGMTRPSRVLAFLDIGGDWDPSLALVMAGAVAVYAAAHRASRRMSAPLLAAAFAAPAAARIDPRLVLGAGIFGAGWGLAGYCPGPALTSIGAGLDAAVWFVAAMLTGVVIVRLADAAFARLRFGRAGPSPRAKLPA